MPIIPDAPEPDKFQRLLQKHAPKLHVLLPDRATIVRPSHIQDGAGGVYMDFIPVYEDVLCRVDPQKGILADKVIERTVGSKQSGVAAYVISFPLNTDLEGQDRILVRGLTFEVVGFTVASYRMVTRCIAVQMIE